MSEICELVIFTAAKMEYADIILNEIDKDNKISHRLYRQHISRHKKTQIKDLSLIGRDLDKVILIDNLADNFSKQPENGIRITSFYGEDADTELLTIAKKLFKLLGSNPEDVRSCLDIIRKN